uniref:Uncharacterized protein n=1 Tax=Opuntia streptacantha TaxID=393608 RepID=A0A7C9AMZ5_OPUST
MFRGVLEHPVPPITILNCINRCCLVAPPSYRSDYGIPRLKNFLVPSVMLYPGLHVSNIVLPKIDSTNKNRMARIKIFNHLIRNSMNLQSHICPCSKAFYFNTSYFI